MYIIYLDDTLIYAPNVTYLDRTCYGGQLDTTVNEAGALVFSITPDSPAYGKIKRKKSKVRLLNGTQQIFSGRVVTVNRDWNNDQRITCEGDLAILGDYKLRASSDSPISYTGSLAQYVRYVLNLYNTQVYAGVGSLKETDKVVNAGTINVVGDDDNDGNEDRQTREINSATSPLDILTELVDKYGGYLVLTSKSGTKYLNYVQNYSDISTSYADVDYTKTCNQRIQFGSNLLSLDEVMDSSDLFTVLIPVGDNNTMLRNPDYVYDADAVNMYGVIQKVENFSGITTTTALRKSATAYLKKCLKNLSSITMSAVDLSMVDSTSDGFEVGTQVEVVSLPHNLQASYVVTAVSIPLEAPGDATYTIGEPQKGLTASMVNPAVVKIVTEKTEANQKAVKKVSTTTATTGSSGLLSAEDKTKLDSLPTLTTAQQQKLLELLS